MLGLSLVLRGAHLSRPFDRDQAARQCGPARTAPHTIPNPQLVSHPHRDNGDVHLDGHRVGWLPTAPTRSAVPWRRPAPAPAAAPRPPPSSRPPTRGRRLDPVGGCNTRCRRGNRGVSRGILGLVVAAGPEEDEAGDETNGDGEERGSDFSSVLPYPLPGVAAPSYWHPLIRHGP